MTVWLESIKYVKISCYTVTVESQPLSTDLDETEEPPATEKSKLARILKCSSKDSDDPQVITLRDEVKKEVQYYIDTPCLDIEENPLQWRTSESSNGSIYLN